MTRDRWPLLPILVAIAVFSPTLWGEFVWDDSLFVSRYYAQGNSLSTIFFPRHSLDSVYFRPISSVLGLWLMKIAGPPNPWAWHLCNVLLHAGTAAGVYYLLRRWTRNADGSENDDSGAIPVAAIGATLFACWPVAAEPVAWISARSEVLLGFFFTWGLVAHLRAREEERESGRTGLAVVAALCFFCALGSKEIGVLFPPTALAATFLLPTRKPWRFTRAEVLLWLLYVFAYFTYSGLRRNALRGHVTSSLPDIARSAASPEALIPAFRSLGYYVREILLLGSGAPFLAKAPAGPGILIFAAIGTLLLLGGFAAALRPAGRRWAFVCVLFLLPLAPAMALAGAAVVVSAVATRYLYLPTIALVAAFAMLAQRLPASWLRPRFSVSSLKGVIGLAVAVGILGALTQPRIRPWLSSRALWERAARDNPDSVLAWHQLAVIELADSRPTAAAEAYRKSANGAGSDSDKHRSWCGLAWVYLRDERFEEARAALDEAGKLDRTSEGASLELTYRALLLLLDPKIDPRGERGITRKELIQQAALLEQAAEADPSAAAPRYALCLTFESLDEPVLAARWYRELERVREGAPGISVNVPFKLAQLESQVAAETNLVRKTYFEGQRLEIAGDLEGAARAYETSLELDPEKTDLLVNLADLKARLGKGPEAVQLAERAAAREPDAARIWFNLGMYRGQSGDFVGAAKALRRATELEPAWAKPQFHLGRALEAAGDFSGAHAAYDATIARVAPNDPLHFLARAARDRVVPRQVGERPLR